MKKIYGLSIAGILLGFTTQVNAQWVTSGTKVYNLGNVGIGITNPLTELHIEGNAPVLRFKATNLGSGVRFDVIGQTGDLFRFQKDGATQMVINNLGNVGIGTTSATHKLDVNGTMRVSNTAVFNSSPTAQIKLNSATTYGALEVFMSNSDAMYGANYSYFNMHRGGSVAWQMGLINNDFVIARGGGAGQKTLFSDRPFMISNSGNVGIGTNSPQTMLHMDGSTNNGITISGTSAGTDEILLQFTESTNYDQFQLKADFAGTGGENKLMFSTDQGGGDILTMKGDGNVGIGTNNPQTMLHMDGSTNSGITISGTSAGTDVILLQFTENTNYDEFQLKADFAGAGGENKLMFSTDLGGGDILTMKADGNVGIGTTNPDAKLAVKGDIHAEEVKVDLSVPGPDYVFEEDYDLTSLKALEAYIKANKHLPEIPSAKEMEEKGIDLGVMNMLLLKKIEELTLHAIQQEKAFDEEKKSNRELMNELLKRMEKLENKKGE